MPEGLKEGWWQVGRHRYPQEPWFHLLTKLLGVPCTEGPASLPTAYTTAGNSGVLSPVNCLTPFLEPFHCPGAAEASTSPCSGHPQQQAQDHNACHFRRASPQALPSRLPPPEMVYPYLGFLSSPPSRKKVDTQRRENQANQQTNKQDEVLFLSRTL